MAARYWRLAIATTNGGTYAQLTEVAFLDANGVDLCVGGAAFANSTYDGGYEADKAFDKNNNTDWCSAARAFPAYIGYQMSAPASVAQVRIVCSATTNWLPRDDTVVKLQASDDGVTWDALAYFPLSIVSGSFVGGATVLLQAGALQEITLRAEPGRFVAKHLRQPAGGVRLAAAGDGFSVRAVASGAGSLTVRVSLKGTPNVPLAALVTLLTLRQKRFVAQGWSDASGVCVFHSVDTKSTRYIAIAEYPTNPDSPLADNYMRPQAGVSALDAEVVLRFP